MDLFGYLIFSADLHELEGQFLARARGSEDGILTVKTRNGELSYVPFARLKAMEIARVNKLAQDAEALLAAKKDHLLAADQKALAKEVEAIRKDAASAAQAETRTISEEVGLVAAQYDALVSKVRLAEIVASYSVATGGKK
jgi:hypothetical protein